MSGNTTSSVISIDYSKNLIVSNNQLIGGMYGFYLSYSFASGIELNCSNILINGNEFRNQTDASLFVPTPNGGVYRNVLAINNTIFIDAGVAIAAYVGIQSGSGVLVSGNNINMIGGFLGIACSGDSVTTPYGYVGSIVEGNVVRTDAGKPSIKIYGGTSNCIIHHNYVVQPIANSQPANNTVENNYTIL